tara:strand:- start:3556 stop:4026 length:471 start_codon:yes stop_codon:yes gene_type:complete
MKYKCPACGYQPNKQEALIETTMIFKNFPKDIQTDLKNIIAEVNKHIYFGKIPIEYKYRFLYGISHIDEESIRRAISTWNRFGYSRQGKTLTYFGAIIRNISETKSANQKAEQQMRGTNPPDINQINNKGENENEPNKKSIPKGDKITVARRSSRI